MKRFFITFSALFFLLSATVAQTAFEQIDADPVKAGAEYNMYPNSVPGSETPPNGYKPFYISHFGRHGARFYSSSELYDILSTLLENAHFSGNLTPKGEDLRLRYARIYPLVRGRGGELTQKGREQQISIAGRMIGNFPSVFKGDVRVEAQSSTVQRCVMSMSAFCRELVRHNPKLDVREDASESFMAYMSCFRNYNPDYVKLNMFATSPERTILKADKALIDNNLHPEDFLSRLFNDVGKIDNPLSKMMSFYFLAMSTNCIDSPENLMDIFTPEELCALWEVRNFDFYSNFGPSKYFKAHPYALSDTLLRRILLDADYDISSGSVAARLRFGHDTGLIGLLALMQADGWSQTAFSPFEVKNLWKGYDIPMAANLQMIFYRNRNGNILVRLMLNEKNVTLPLPSVDGHYYSWSVLRRHLEDRLLYASEILASVKKDPIAIVKKNPLMAGGVYYVNPYSKRDYTPAPDGFKPFYISDYGRHGARYILDEAQYTHIHKALTLSSEAGALTAAGEMFRDKFESVYPSVKGRAGILSRKGAEQLRDLGKRMWSAYPEIFKNDPSIAAVSSYIPRTMLSMSSFADGLRERDPNVDVTMDCSKAYMGFMNPFSRDWPDFNIWNRSFRGEEALWRSSYNHFCDSLLSPAEFLGRYFKDMKLLESIAPLRDLEFDIFFMATGMQCLDEDVSFIEMFTPSELAALWEADNACNYSEKGPDPRNYGRGSATSCTMLHEIIERTESDLADGKVDVRLRFGHDGCIMSFLSLLGIDKWGVATTDYSKVKDLWQTYDVSMASNLVFVFYRNVTGDDVIFKLLWNEKNVTLPFEAYDGPYYKWSAFKDYYKPLLAIADSVMDTSDSSGAPIVLYGKVSSSDGRPLSGIQVSDGKTVVTTDASGRYGMFSLKENGVLYLLTPGTGSVASSAPGSASNSVTNFIASSAAMSVKLTEKAWIPERHDFIIAF